MADDNRVLRCLVSGDTTSFKVAVPAEGDVVDLEELVLEKGRKGILHDVDAKDLVLWKVSHFQRLA
jgi:hypothetical protein